MVVKQINGGSTKYSYTNVTSLTVVFVFSQVRSFFAYLRQQPREAQLCPEPSVPSSLNSLPDLYVHNESQFFEVGNTLCS